MKLLINSKRFFSTCLLFIYLIFGCSSSSTTEEVHYIYMKCGLSKSNYVPPDTKIEIISFLSVDTMQVDQLPEIMGGIDTVLAIIKYPEIARRAGIEGIVIIEFTIVSLGKAKNYKVVKGIGAGCDDAVIGALIFDLKFLPAIKDGKAVNLLMRTAVKFNLIPLKSKSDFFPRPIYFNNDALKYRSRFSLYPPPNQEEPDSANSTGN